MTTARNFCGKFAVKLSDLSVEIASWYLTCHQGMLPLHRENRKEPDWLCRENGNGDIAGKIWLKQRRNKAIIACLLAINS